MYRLPRFGIAAISLAALGLMGCANPAADKPAAVVTDAAEGAQPLPEADGTTYTLTDASSLNFVGSKVTGSHDGGFREFDGAVTVPGDSIESARIDIRIDTTSIWSDTEKLTGHLKSADFFEVETYPEARFVSTRIAGTESGFDVTGNLTLHGVTKTVTFPAQIELKDGVLTALAEFALDRTQFGINYQGKAGDLIRDEVVVAFDIRAEA